MRGATSVHRTFLQCQVCFNPRPSCEGRPDGSVEFGGLVQFQSTPLMRGATSGSKVAFTVEAVSIHAPHARGDHKGMARVLRFEVSIHAPHARGDSMTTCICESASLFQSTPLMRGATSGSTFELSQALKFQSTPLMRGATGFRQRHDS